MPHVSKPAVYLAGLGSAAMLLAALGFQYIGGLAPCELCIWQRWPHLLAVLILIAWAATGWRILLVAGALAALTTAGIGVFHLGVENGWWDYISSCTQGSLAGESASSLLPGSGAAVAPPIRCDAIAWSFMGLSMASWNAIASTGLAGIWLFAACRKP